MNTIKKQILELNKIETDQERLLFCQNNNNFSISLDNDAAYISLNMNNLTDEEYEELVELINWENSSFIEDFGNRSGVTLLLKMLNISSEDV